MGWNRGSEFVGVVWPGPAVFPDFTRAQTREWWGSLYSDFVWDCRKKRLLARKPALDWVVMRNRIIATDARNKRRISSALDALASRIGFRVAPGFGERVIFRELFPLGLTMLDLPQPGLDISMSMSHVAARQEVRELLLTLKLPGVEKID